MIQEVKTSSGIPVREVYTGPVTEAALPGIFPYTRGIQADMYRGKMWTMRQYAGFSTAEESNKRYKYLLAQGTTGLSVAFDLPTQIGYDSDHLFAEGEVGKVGVAIDSLIDMEQLFDGIDLSQISTSMTINATAAILLCMYIAVAKKQGIDLKLLSGTIQNDILKEYAARGTYIYPPQQSMRLITDIFAYCSEELPRWNTISISGYHIREAGSTAVQELAFTLANGKAYVKAAIAVGLDINIFAPRLSFFFNCHNNFFEEIAKFRAARRMWAKITTELGATDPKAHQLRFHCQTGGSTLTAQQPLNNIVRTTIQAMAAIMGGTQSLHTNGYDEALSLPTEQAATIALRTQQILAVESGISSTADPLAGSYFVESLTDEIEELSLQYIDQIDKLGGSVKAIETGFIQKEIAEAAYQFQKDLEQHKQSIVGVNIFVVPEKPLGKLFQVSDQIRVNQTDKLAVLRSYRQTIAVLNALENLRIAAGGTENLIPYILIAVENYATLGEISDILRSEFGEYQA